MKKYAIIAEDGITILEYPLSEEDLSLRYTRYSFPLEGNELTNQETTGFSYPPNVVEVFSKTLDNLPDATDPVLLTLRPYKDVDGIWKEITMALTEEQQALKIEIDNLRSSTRARRNALLKFTDVYVIADRWEKLDQLVKDSLSTYRQELRDLEYRSAGKEEDIVWPEPPPEINMDTFQQD